MNIEEKKIALEEIKIVLSKIIEEKKLEVEYFETLYFSEKGDIVPNGITITVEEFEDVVYIVTFTKNNKVTEEICTHTTSEIIYFLLEKTRCIKEKLKSLDEITEILNRYFNILNLETGDKCSPRITKERVYPSPHTSIGIEKDLYIINIVRYGRFRKRIKSSSLSDILFELANSESAPLGVEYMWKNHWKNEDIDIIYWERWQELLGRIDYSYYKRRKRENDFWGIPEDLYGYNSPSIIKKSISETLAEGIIIDEKKVRELYEKRQLIREKLVNKLGHLSNIGPFQKIRIDSNIEFIDRAFVYDTFNLLIKFGEKSTIETLIELDDEVSVTLNTRTKLNSKEDYDMYVEKLDEELGLRLTDEFLETREDVRKKRTIRKHWKMRSYWLKEKELEKTGKKLMPVGGLEKSQYVQKILDSCKENMKSGFGLKEDQIIVKEVVYKLPYNPLDPKEKVQGKYMENIKQPGFSIVGNSLYNYFNIEIQSYFDDLKVIANGDIVLAKVESYESFEGGIRQFDSGKVYKKIMKEVRNRIPKKFLEEYEKNGYQMPMKMGEITKQEKVKGKHKGKIEEGNLKNITELMCKKMKKQFRKGTVQLIQIDNIDEDKRVIDIKFVGYEWGVYNLRYEKGKIWCYIKGDKIQMDVEKRAKRNPFEYYMEEDAKYYPIEKTMLSISNPNALWSETNFDRYFEELSENIKLRIPDKFLESRGWKREGFPS